MRRGKELILATRPFAQEQRGRSWWGLASTLVLLIVMLFLTCLDVAWPMRLIGSIFTGLLLIRLFVIYHDYLHGAILQQSWLARMIFTAFGWLFLTPPSIWKHSHDYHHHHHGQYPGNDLGTWPLMSTHEFTQATRWQRLGYTVIRSPMIMLLGYFTSFLFCNCVKPLLAAPRLHLDAAGALLLQVGLVAALANFAPDVLLFSWLLPVMVAAALGAYLFYAQHNYPAAWFPVRAEWDYVTAALSSSSFMRLHPVLHWFTANIGYHHVHHLNARIPFYRLPEAMAGIAELQSPGTTSLHPLDVHRCLRLKLWDPQRERLVSFGEWRKETRAERLASSSE